jgi:HK97 family phage portal protein
MEATVNLMGWIRSWFDGMNAKPREPEDVSSLRRMQHDTQGTFLIPLDSGVLFTTGQLPTTKIDYAREVGDGLGSSVLVPVLNWIARNFTQAPVMVERLVKDQWTPDPEHPVLDLLQEPNPFYGGRELWMATILEFLLTGNAYWLKVRNGAGEVVQLWWVPGRLIVPRWPTDGSVFIDHYEYRPGGRAIDLEVSDVVHFRYGIDPRNTRLGLSPVAALVREICTDDQAAHFQNVILRNLGIIGVVIAPKERGLASREDVESTKRYLEQHFTGDRRGKPLALGQPTEVTLLQYNLQGFDVSPLRDVSEERVCAALGVPAAVVGFGTGLQTTKVGVTMREMRRMAWTDCIIPLQGMLAEQATRQLLAEFAVRPHRIRLIFDSRVPSAWEDPAEKYRRVTDAYMSDVIRRSEARRELGYPTGPDDEVYVQPANVFLRRPGETDPRSSGGTHATANPD